MQIAGLILFAFLGFINCECPSGTISSFTDPNNCFSFQSQKNYFMDGEGICEGLGGHLVVVENMFDNVFITDQALKQFTNISDTDFWIGATNLLNGAWTTMNGQPLNFTDWEKGQPQNSSSSGCGAITMGNGRWISDDCFTQKPFVCLIKATSGAPTTALPPPTTAKPKSCGDAWTFYNFTGFCYKVFHNESWLDSETRCRIDQAHLASIHSLEENLFLANLASSTSDSYYGWEGQTWMGLYTEDDNVEWQWSDGTPLDYLNWAPGEPNLASKENCGQLWSGSLVNQVTFGAFNNYPCDLISFNYICKKLPK